MSREYRVAFLYHEPESRQLFERGVIVDYESTARIFIVAESEEEALTWCEAIAKEMLWRCNDDRSLDWKDLGYSCWIECDRALFGFFQHVKAGEMPNFDAMGTHAYLRWQDDQSKSTF
ncbi:hypothetical protein SAMN04487926_10313 [Paraburkholderia steynii]|jgi:hypothetical protein|uniref:Uncharacterized protein n=1 Tax=Paraburkholderia steynii TaxID=1245441 RepID=A0A7Z7B1Z6_9BURK|nr:hypothetical protein [Paraburkholderia steynii]SDH23830.1 hypothetical protein SAMN04487926_10313 [Paraburkholderia steynii]